MRRSGSHISQTSAAAVLLLIAVTACGGPEQSGRFEIGGVRSYESCLNAMFPFRPSFFAVRKRIDSVGLFMQSRARFSQEADLVYIERFQSDGRQQTGTQIPLSFPAVASSEARAEVAPNESCPDFGESLAVRGSVQFDKFGTETGDRIVGQLTNGKILDARRGETVADSFSGNWQFSVEITAPHRSYPTDRNDYPSDP